MPDPDWSVLFGRMINMLGPCADTPIAYYLDALYNHTYQMAFRESSTLVLLAKKEIAHQLPKRGQPTAYSVIGAFLSIVLLHNFFCFLHGC